MKKTLLMLALSVALGATRARLLWSQPAQVSPANLASAHPMAPDFSLTDLANHKLDLATYRGKVVLLNFWATWCTPCRTETPQFVDLQKKYGADGLQIIGISLDDDAKPVRAFYKKFKMNYPVAVGDATLAERYGGILGLPVSFLVGCDGGIYGKYTGVANSSHLAQNIKLLLNAKQCEGKDPI